MIKISIIWETALSLLQITLKLKKSLLRRAKTIPITCHLWCPTTLSAFALNTSIVFPKLALWCVPHRRFKLCIYAVYWFCLWVWFALAWVWSSDSSYLNGKSRKYVTTSCVLRERIGLLWKDIRMTLKSITLDFDRASTVPELLAIDDVHDDLTTHRDVM